MNNITGFIAAHIDELDGSIESPFLEQIKEEHNKSLAHQFEVIKYTHAKLLEKEPATNNPIENWEDYERKGGKWAKYIKEGEIFDSLEATSQAREENKRTINDFKAELTQKKQELAQLNQELAIAQQQLASAQAMPCNYIPCEYN